MDKFEVLKTYFGYDSFRNGQETLIDALLSGQDALGVMPTGAGKSLCFQLPALMLPGITIVVSPLISLMKDHVAALKSAGVAAAYLNSSLTANQYALAVRNLQQGKYKIVYVAPERLLVPGFLRVLEGLSVSLLAVDEAHCISQWGQDFRPSYLDIPQFVAALPTRPPIAAFTATATAKVREDIAQRLQLTDFAQLVTGFDRPNLFFEVSHPHDKKSELLRRVRAHQEDCGIVYCSTRKAVEEVTEYLIDHDIDATRYHAGLTPAERQHNQDAFRLDKVQVMVATNAFGMGIDKSNVRFVLHYNMPLDLESYYQEAGRAGRDGLPADCILLYSGRDVQTGKFLIDKSAQEVEDAALRASMLERAGKRLRDMTYYCTSAGCLRHYILQYFGQSSPAVCDSCSNCRAGTEEVDITLDARLIVDCVAQLRGRFGAQMIACVLRGTENERVMNFGFDQLDSFGKLTGKPLSAVLAEIDFLVSISILIESEGKYPTLCVGPCAQKILQSSPVLMRRIKQAPARTATAAKQSAKHDDPALWNALCSLRKELATHERVPAFVIFSDATLADLCAKRPTDLDELRQVSGVGMKKSERYGAAFLRVLAEHRAN